jgi:hypothetical protein
MKRYWQSVLGTVVVVLGCLAVAACGTSTPAGPPQVALLLTAPTSGATVGVQTIKVAGTVTPNNAVVRIAGRRAHVRKGTFVASVRLLQRTTRIRIVARAHGYLTARMQTTVHFSNRTAKGMLTAEHDALSTRPTAVAGTGGGLALPLNTAAGHREFTSNCLGNSTDAASRSACTCLYTHFLQSGDFNSRQKEAALVVQIHSAQASGDMSQVPIAVRSTLVACGPQIYGTGGSSPPGG